MRNLTLTTFFLCASFIASFAQVGIGTTSPNASSILDLTSTDKAFMPPRLSTAQRNSIGAPASGMMIFNTDSTCVEIYRGSSWFNICTGKSSGATLPPVNGFTSSDQVAASNLIGHWPFDGNATEKTHTKNPVLSGGTSSYKTGKIGQAISLTNGWLTYPADATGAGVPNNQFGNSDTLGGGFTLSMWVQLPASSNLSNLFQLSKQNVANWPLLGLAFRKRTDTVDMNGGLTNLDGTGTHPTYGDAYTNNTFKDSLSWAFLTMTYDTSGAGHKLVYYANGIKRATVDLNTIGSKAFPAGGNLQMLCAFPAEGNYATIGTFEGSGRTPGSSSTIPGFMNDGITASIDDIRFYSTKLTDLQISSLFQLGNQGR